MMKHQGDELCYFISDIHLASADEDSWKLFMKFAQEEACKAQHLYILGDLFEVWIGDDAPMGTLKPIVTQLRRLSAMGTQIYIMHGNRDFLLGEHFTHSIGARLLSEYTVINLFGEPTLLLHGDSLCIDDTAYQAFRAQVRQPQWQQQFLMQPIATRQAYAQQAREKSSEHKTHSVLEIMDVNLNEVKATMARDQVQQMIHGHTHRPAVHRLTIDSKKCVRYVLGDWSEETRIIRATSTQISLLRYSHLGFAE